MGSRSPAPVRPRRRRTHRSTRLGRRGREPPGRSADHAGSAQERRAVRLRVRLRRQLDPPVHGGPFPHRPHRTARYSPRPTAAVLVGDVSPAPVRQRLVGDYTELFYGVYAGRAHRAQVGPAVAEVELVDELLVVLEPSQRGPPTVQEVLGLVVPVGSTYVCAVGEVELVQVSAIPSPEGVIDGGGELGEG